MTAYEMRISDWSSDVCSSDLYQPQLPLREGLPRRLRLLPYWDHPRRGRLTEAEFLHLPDRVGLLHGLTTWLLREGLARLLQWREHGGADLQLVLRLPDAALRALAFQDLIPPTIGRASCRDNVCTYAWISVVAGSRKKK